MFFDLLEPSLSTIIRQIFYLYRRNTAAQPNWQSAIEFFHLCIGLLNDPKIKFKDRKMKEGLIQCVWPIADVEK